jgi:hypothetical protein
MKAINNNTQPTYEEGGSILKKRLHEASFSENPEG